MSDLKEILDAIDESTKEAAWHPYLDSMKMVYRGMWDKGKAILEQYPTVQDGGKGGRPQITDRTGGGVLSVISYSYVANETERGNDQIKKWVILARRYPTQETAEKWINEEAESVTERYLGRRTRGYIRAETPPLPEGKWPIIYADPPWDYSDNRPSEWGEYREKHYPPMSTDVICELKITDIRADNSVLFIWAIVPMIRDALRVINQWGFSYKTHFVWDKIKHNLGHYSSVRHELLMLAVKGSKLVETSKRLDSVISIERTEKHGEKPDEFRQLIDTLYPSGRAIELFSRKKDLPERWDVWGKDVRDKI